MNGPLTVLIMQEQLKRYKISLTEGYAFNNFGLIASHIDILKAENNDNMGELLAKALYGNFIYSTVKKELWTYIGTDDAEKQQNIDVNIKQKMCQMNDDENIVRSANGQFQYNVN